MAAKIKVTYLDGRTETVRVSPRAQIQVEEHLHGVGERNMLMTSYRLAWQQLRNLGLEDAEFDKWIDEIEDVEEVSAPADPTPGGAAAPAESSTSPSVPESPSVI